MGASAVSDAARSVLRLIDAYLRQLDRRGLSAATLKNYGLDLYRFAEHLRQQHGITEIDGVAPLHVDDYLSDLQARSYKPASINRNLSAIRQFFKYLVRLRVIGQLDNPAVHVENARVRRRTPVYLEIDEAATLLLTIRAQSAASETARWLQARDFALFALFLGTGLRVQELAHIDRKEWQTAVENGLLRVVGKGDKERYIPLVAETVAAVRRYVRLRPADAADPALFVSKQRRRLTVRQIQNLVRRYTALAGLEKPITPHKLRHTYASQLVLSGAPLLEIKELLGHEDLNTTKVYTHINPEHLKEVVKRHQVRYLD